MPSEDVIANLSVKGQAAFSQAMTQAGQSAKGVSQETDQAGQKSGLSAKGMLKAAAAAGIAYKGYSMLKGSVNTTGELAKSTAAFARASGLSTKESGQWVAVAKSRGIETKQLQMGMATFGRQLGATGGSSKAANAALAKLGVTQQDLMKMPMDQRMSTVADSFSKLADGPEKAALAQKLFGRSGQQLIPILNEGGDALRGQLDAAGKLIPVTAGGQKKALDMAKAQREMGMATEGLKVAIGTALVPILGGLTKAITPIINVFANLMAKSSAFRIGIVALAAGIGILVVATKLWTVAQTAAAIATKIWIGIQWLLNAALLANPIGLIVVAIAALIAGIILAYKNVGWFRDAVDAAFGAIKVAVGAVVDFFKNNWQLIGTILLATSGPIGWIILAFLKFKDQIIGAVQAVIGFILKIPGAIGSMVSGVAGAIGKIVSTLGTLPGKLKSAASAAVNALVSGFTSAIGKVSDIGHKIIHAIVQAIKSGASAVMEAVKSIIPDVGSMVGDAVDKVKGSIPGLDKLATGGLITAQAGNTIRRAGGQQLVGERGPELANFPSGTRITPLPPPSLRPSQLDGSGAGQITIPVYLDRRQIALAMGDYSAERQAAR